MSVLGRDKSVRADDNEEKICVTLNFSKLGIITVSLPSLSLIVCFVSAVLFQYDQVTETACNVTNTVPSVSAVTGVSPQRYLWRVGIALHAAPRFAIGLIYLKYYEKCRTNVRKDLMHLYDILRYCSFCFYTIENSCLILVSYISNLENYPIHEKLFVVFMFTCCLYQITTVALFNICFPQRSTLPHIEKSYKRKVTCLSMLSISTACLLVFFICHRFFCIPGAFTYFSIAEYFIVASVTCFHFTATLDFKNCVWSANLCIAAKGMSASSGRRETNCHESKCQKAD